MDYNLAHMLLPLGGDEVIHCALYLKKKFLQRLVLDMKQIITMYISKRATGSKKKEEAKVTVKGITLIESVN